jgi:ATP/maltotriose-dependent transcriptional regulator MalT
VRRGKAVEEQQIRAAHPRPPAYSHHARYQAAGDERREHHVVWIVGPPGAGKTTLAAIYLEEAGAPAIWYQIDPGDSDPATFYLFLKQAIRQRDYRPGRDA